MTRFLALGLVVGISLVSGGCGGGGAAFGAGFGQGLTGQRSYYAPPTVDPYYELRQQQQQDAIREEIRRQLLWQELMRPRY